MIGSVRKVVGEAFDAYMSTPRKEWVVEWPGQVVICVGSVFWTSEVTAAFKANQGLPVSAAVLLWGLWCGGSGCVVVVVVWY